MSAAGAWRLTRQIREFWAAAGFAVRVEVVHTSGTDAPVHYSVRTDMIAGYREPTKPTGRAQMASGEDVQVVFGASIEGLTPRM